MPHRDTLFTRTDFTGRPASGLAIEATAISKTYGSGNQAHAALHAIDVSVPIGCIYGLLGPNGAGKSTLINIMAGTVIKCGGRMSIWGTDIDANPRQARANIGIVPQELNIDAFFTPRETLDMLAGLFGVPKAERQTDANSRNGWAYHTGRYLCAATFGWHAAKASDRRGDGASPADSGFGRTNRRRGCNVTPTTVGQHPGIK